MCWIKSVVQFLWSHVVMHFNLTIKNIRYCHRHNLFLQLADPNQPQGKRVASLLIEWMILIFLQEAICGHMWVNTDTCHPWGLFVWGKFELLYQEKVITDETDNLQQMKQVQNPACWVYIINDLLLYMRSVYIILFIIILNSHPRTKYMIILNMMTIA